MRYKIILACVCAFILFFWVSNARAANFYGCTALTGGGSGALDALDITGASTPNADNLADGDTAVYASITGTTATRSIYIFDADGTDAESSPDVIRPDDYSTGGVWRREALEAAIDTDGDRSFADETWYTGLAQVSGDTYTGTHNLGGADEVEIPNGTDPDSTNAGSIAYDTDGANVSNDASIRANDGVNQWVAAMKLQRICRTIVSPQDFDPDTRDLLPFWSNDSGYTFTITRILCMSDTDDTDLTINEYPGRSNLGSATTVDAIAIDANGTSVYYKTETTITHATIEAGHVLAFDFDDTDDPGWIECTVEGWLDADVD